MMMEAIGGAPTIRQVHAAHRQALRGGADPWVANAKRDEAIARLLQQQQQQQQDGDSSSMAEAQEVMPRVFLGPFAVARDGRKLRRLGITHVVCLYAEGRCDSLGSGAVTYLEHPLVEVECTLERGAEQIARVVPSCVDFVQSALSAINGDHENNGTTKVLIHCLHGKTRSAAVASCVRAVCLNESFEQAYGRIANVRDVFVPVEWRGRLQEVVEEQKAAGTTEAVVE